MSLADPSREGSAEGPATGNGSPPDAVDPPVKKTRRFAGHPRPAEGNHHQDDQNGQDGRASLFLACASDLATVKPEWIWPGRLRRGTVAFVQGDTGVGKSSFLRALAADLTGGPPLTRKRKRPKPLGSVLWFAGEEQLEVTVKPGLAAAGADLRRCHCADTWRGEERGRLALPADRERLGEAIGRASAVLVVLDPVFNFSDGSCDLDGPTLPARRFMSALAGVAERTGCLIVLTRNLTKDRTRGALSAGRGSAELGNAARSALHLERLPGRTDLFALATAKVNDSALPPTLTYTLAPGPSAALFQLGGPVELSADDLAGGEDAALDRTTLDRAVALLRQVLRDGEAEGRVVKQKAADDAIAERTLLKAARVAGVLYRREGSRKDATCYWRLPRGK